MGAVVSLVVFAIGAILRFATNFQSSTWNIRTIGDILMIVGVVGLVLSIVAFFYPNGFGMGGMVRRRRAAVRREPTGPARPPDEYGRGAYRPDGTVDPTRRFPTVIEEEERSGY